MIIFGAIYSSNFDSDAAKRRLEKHFLELEKTGFVETPYIQEGESWVSCNLSTLIDLEEGHFKSHGLSGYKEISIDRFGEFCEIEITKCARSIKIFATGDMLGSCPLFYYSGETACVSNDLLAIAKYVGLRDMNLNSIYSLLVTGHSIYSQSTVSEIHRIWPGQEFFSEADFSSKPISTIKKDFSMTYQLRTTSTSIHAEKAFTSLALAVKKLGRSLENGIVQLSGGLDSRITAGVIRQEHPKAKINAITLDISNIEELKSAKSVAKSLDLIHRLESLDLNLNEIHSGFLLTGGQVSCLAAATNLQMYRHQNEYSHLYIIGAWPGDCLIGSYIPKHKSFLDEKKTMKSIARWVSLRNSNMPVSRYYNSQTAKVLHDVFLNEFESSVTDCSGTTAAQKISYWAMFKRQPTFSYISPARLCSRISEVTPMLSGDYVMALLSLSPTEIYRKNFYRKMLHDHLPELGKIPYDQPNHEVSKSWNNPAFSIKEWVKFDLPNGIYPLLLDVYQRVTGRSNFANLHELDSFAGYMTDLKLDENLLKEILNSPDFTLGRVFGDRKNSVDQFYKLLTIQKTHEYLNN